MALGRLSVVLDANIAKFESDMGRAARIAQQQSAAMQRSIEGAAKRIGVVLGGAFAVRSIEQFVQTGINGMLQLSTAAKQVGMPVEQFTALSAVAKRADVDMQSFTASVLAADRALAQAQSGKGAQAQAFKALGIDPKQIKDNNDLILKAADALSKYRDGVGKSAVEMTIFGKSGAELNAFLDQGSRAIQEQTQHMQELGVAFGPDAQAQLAAFDNAQKEFSDTLQGLRNRIVIALLPSLQSATEYIGKYVGSMDSDAVSGFTAIINTLARATIVVGGAFETAGHAIGAFVAAQVTGYKALFDAAKSPTHALAILKSGARDVGDILGNFSNDEATAWNKRIQAITEFGNQAAKAMAKASGGDAGRKMLTFNPNATAVAKVKTPEDFTKALRDQVLQLTLSSKGFELYQLAARGASDADLKYADSLIDVRDKLKAQADAQKALDDFVAQHRAEMQGVTDAELQFRDTMDMATKALNAHMVTWEQFSRIAGKAVEDLNGKAKDQFDQMSEFAKEAARNMQDAFADFLFDPFKHGIKGMLGDFADALRRMAANALAAKVFDSIGSWGKANQGSGGWEGMLASFASAFGGGKAVGGYVAPMSMYRVNERGPELLSVAGKDFLMMGAQGGTVTPNSKLGGSTQVINVNVRPTTTRRTADQVATAVARQQRIATSRNG